MQERASVYLETRAEAMITSLNFFMGTSSTAPGTKRRLVFLAQIEFWEWELDNVVYAFESFEERARAWSSAGSVLGTVSAQGFVVPTNKVKSVREKDRWESWARRRGYKGTRQKVVAPVDTLRRLVYTWNNLLDQCNSVVNTSRKKFEDMGMAIKIPSDYKKTLPEIYQEAV